MAANEARERFKRLASKRTANVLRTLRVLGHCANPHAYEYTEDELDRIFSAIEKQVKITKNKFQYTKEKDIDFKL